MEDDDADYVEQAIDVESEQGCGSGEERMDPVGEENEAANWEGGKGTRGYCEGEVRDCFSLHTSVIRPRYPTLAQSYSQADEPDIDHAWLLERDFYIIDYTRAKMCRQTYQGRIQGTQCTSHKVVVSASSARS